VKQFIET
jgi:hypothetical protein